MYSGEGTKIGGTEIRNSYTTESNLLNELIGPFVSVIGEQLAEEARKHNLVNLSGKEKNNLREQVNRVLSDKSLKINDGLTRKQRYNLLDWMDKASEANPNNDNEKEESAKWQAILGEILKDNDQSILNTLKSLNKYDIRLIHSIGKGRNINSTGKLDRLVNLGLIEKASVFENPIIVMMIAIGLVMVIPAFIPEIINVAFGTLGSSDGYALVSSAYGLTILGTVGIYIYKIRKRVHFTEMGLNVKDKVEKYFK